MMWDSVVPDDHGYMISQTDGCSDAVAREAAPSSANVILNDDITPEMPPGAVNLGKVTSTMGRGPIEQDDGESVHRLKDDAQLNNDCRVTDARTTDKTSDGERSV